MIRLWAVAISIVVIGLLGLPQDAAAASGTVVIDSVRAGTPTSASEEFVTLRNASDIAVDISGWKVIYTSASGATSTTLVTFASTVPDHILLPSGVSETLFSNNLATALALDVSAITFTPGLNATGGTISLRNASGELVDRVGWGTATQFEGVAAPGLGTQVLQRATGNDSDDNSVDFSLLGLEPALDLLYGGLVDVTDVCTNIDGIQLTVPAGLMQLPDGTCRMPDVCSNLDGIQSEVPVGYQLEADGTCSQIDLCENMDGIQTDTSGYEVVGANCYLPFVPADIRLTELLPNPQGVDTGNEFIELYNASDDRVWLDDYRLRIDSKLYVFPTASSIEPGEYAVFSDTQLKVTFANTTGKVVELMGRDGTLVDSLPAYTNAPDDQSWAFVDDEWQYTNQPTPGEPNKASLVGSGSTGGVLAGCGEGRERNPATGRCRNIPIASQLVPCGPGQERNPATNRCRSSLASAASLVPCREGQYRNPLTNRCKSIAAELASTLTPCKVGQERNLETNRCRKIASASTLQPCAEGQERNPATNRCRKVASATPPKAAFPVEAVKDTATSFAAWWALGGVVVLGLGYAGWEYRHEVGAFVRRIMSRGKA